MNSKMLCALVILAVSCGYLAAQSRPAAHPRDAVLRASRLEITNGQGAVVFIVASNNDGDGNLELLDANGKMRFQIVMPRLPMPNIPNGTSPGINVKAFNEDGAADFDFSSGNLLSGGILAIRGGTKLGIGDVQIVADKNSGGAIAIQNSIANQVVQLTASDNKGDGRVTVSNHFGYRDNSLIPKP